MLRDFANSALPDPPRPLPLPAGNVARGEDTTSSFLEGAGLEKEDPQIESTPPHVEPNPPDDGVPEFGVEVLRDGLVSSVDFFSLCDCCGFFDWECLGACDEGVWWVEGVGVGVACAEGGVADEWGVDWDVERSEREHQQAQFQITLWHRKSATSLRMG